MGVGAFVHFLAVVENLNIRTVVGVIFEVLPYILTIPQSRTCHKQARAL